MRVLLTGLPIHSHVLPALVPIANALQRGGHEVAIATGAAVAAEVERHGVPVLPLPDVLAPHELGSRPDLVAEAKLEVSPQKMRRWRPEVTGPLSVPVFNNVLTARFAANLIEAARTWRPDVIVRETNEYGGYLAAEVLGLPLATVDIAPLIVGLVPDLTERLNLLRDDLGLPAIGSFAHAYGGLTAGLLPERWYPAALRTPAHRYYRAPDAVDDRPLDQAIANLPSDAPLVLAAFGSNVHSLLPAESELMNITAEALGSLPVRAVFALGSAEAVSSWSGPRPANVHLAPFVQQRLLLGACDAFLTHAGFSGVRESLSAGVPMVALPLFSDQPENATRVDELGVGIHADAAGLTVDGLATTLKRVLDEPSYRLAARAFQRQIFGRPALATFATDLEAMLRSRA